MKRIKAACITQTVIFSLKEDFGRDYAAKHVQEEVQRYKRQLDRSKIQYRILSEETQADGSVIIEIKKQYNNSPVGKYMD
ncbi:MAG: hypothetical protein NC432_03145 [Roseburia sp.]|nr:hypothetical protein [Roseburia sp.]MCM1097069.1 hypothetical protein [Ruminococcus flavefaciens]